MNVENMHTPHILELTLKAKQDFLDSFDLVFFDCDGVIWLILGVIQHANEAVNLLKDAGKKCKFVSNNSIRSDANYLEKFRKIGVRDVLENDIMHPAKAMIHYIKTHLPPDAKVFSICDSIANELFRKNEINVKTLEYKEELTPLTLEDTVHLRGEKVDAVLFDINLNLNYSQLARACLYLQQNDQCSLIVGGSDSFLPLTADLTILGFNCFADLLKKQTKQEPIILGKPGKALYEILKETYNIENPKRVLFVGDTLNFDIGFAKQCGFQTLLVLTGVAKKEDMLTAPFENRPDFYADGIFDFIELFKDLQKKINME